MLRVWSAWLSYLESFSKDMQSILGHLLALTKLLRELTHLPPQLHWFCKSHDGTTYTDQASDPAAGDHTPIKIEDSKDEEVEYRRSLVTDCLQLFAYDGEDVLPHQEYLKQHVDRQLGKCDTCIVEYYKAKHRAVQALRRCIHLCMIYHNVR